MSRRLRILFSGGDGAKYKEVPDFASSIPKTLILHIRGATSYIPRGPTSEGTPRSENPVYAGKGSSPFSTQIIPNCDKRRIIVEFRISNMPIYHPYHTSRSRKEFLRDS